MSEVGLFGPDSVTWQVHADPAMVLGGIRSLFLQALHPRAVAGVLQNSDFRTNPLGRLKRTADFIGTTTYGTAEQAHAAAARVRAIHRALRATDPDTGESYPLDDPDLLLWVHCAEVSSFLSVTRRAGYPLTKAHADRYLAEQRTSAELVGIDPADVPTDTAAMTTYFRRIRPHLRHTPDADEIYAFLHRPPIRGALAVGLPLYEPAIGHLSYSLLPGWAHRVYGRRPYPRHVATAMARALRSAAPHLRPIIRAAGAPEPATAAAIRRLGPQATPSAARLPA
ncbi:oxygenase MpaB family protein [Actinokineospora inagensis]|uniref:oxygenase MpaB family protein n=1 Tax=Actinokineospora inagensis TaxID=103730 RepID=UPI0004273D55|nr:oxygenase MpaB family protein [Actinokineospora inagensis]